MRLVGNLTKRNHSEAIQETINQAEHIQIAVAFLKAAGLREVSETLRKRLKSKAEAEIFVGRDFYLTEPDALDELLELQQRYPKLTVRLSKQRHGATFHPKLYVGRRGGTSKVLIGSANLTGGALRLNDECSIALDITQGAPLLNEVQEVFARFKKGDRFDLLDRVVLEQYRTQFNRAQRVRQKVEQDIAAEFRDEFNLDLLSKYNAEFRLDPHEMEALHRRRTDRKKARSHQQKIAKLDKQGALTSEERSQFTGLFRDLITSGDGHLRLWHSGDIHRRGQAALSKPKKTIELFALARSVSGQDIECAYEALRDKASLIDGVGINIVTEILCTFRPTRFAVFNGNTIKALQALGASPPKSATFIAPSSYKRVCGLIAAVQKRIGAEDFTEADAFLNWIYQEKIKRRANPSAVR